MPSTITPNIPNLTDKGLSEAYLAGAVSAEADLSWAAIFPWDGIDYTAVGFAPPSSYATDTENGDIATEEIVEAYKATITVLSVSLGYACSQLARLTMTRDVLMRLFMQLGALPVRYFAKELYTLLNNAIATNGPDGVPLASASHPSLAGNQSNYVNSSLGFSSYESAQRSLMELKNHRGTLMGARGTKLIVPPALNVTAFQILSAPNNADDLSKPNPNAGTAALSIAPDLTSSTRWFLFDETKTSFRAPVVRGPSPWVIEEEEKSLRYEVRDKIHAGFGYLDWRGTVVG